MNPTADRRLAPPLIAAEWMNVEHPLELQSLRGKIVVLETFQMLCPGCVSHSLPQARAIHEYFPRDAVQVVGLHSVFEHHDAMSPISLRAFLHEYRIDFPIAVDAHDAHRTPRTMSAYGMRGTPTLTLIDRGGVVRSQSFGRVSDLHVGAAIAGLMGEPIPAEPSAAPPSTGSHACDDDGCPS